MNSRVYLDWNATAPLRPEARAAMMSALDSVGNPSSVHAEGRAAKAIVERARAQVASAVGCQPQEVVFTSGATEAAGVLSMLPHGTRVLVDPTAHDAVFAHRSRDMNDHAEAVVALGLANSETGVLSEIPSRDDAGAFQWQGHRGDRLFLDVTQAIGRIPFSFAWSGADLAILSAHKLGGPKGVGALIVRQGIDIAPLTVGGGQEMSRRSGTENVAGIAGFGAAIEAAVADLASGVWDEVEKLRNILEKTLSDAAKETIFVGQDVARLPNTSCILSPGWKGETQVMQMDLAGFAVSAGSACSSGKVRESRVLKAMGFDDASAASAIRVSLGPGTSEMEIERFCTVWTEKYQKHRRRAA